MKAYVGASLILLSVLALVVVGAAQESVAFNLMVSDQGVRLIEGFTEVRIYEIDPGTEKRLDLIPLAILPNPKSPIKLLLDPGHYELVVWMFYLPIEVSYFRFEIKEGETNLIDLGLIELPEELMTY